MKHIYIHAEKHITCFARPITLPRCKDSRAYVDWIAVGRIRGPLTKAIALPAANYVLFYPR